MFKSMKPWIILINLKTATCFVLRGVHAGVIKYNRSNRKPTP